MSGDMAGQSSTFMWLAVKKSRVTLAVCGQALSCCSVPCPWKCWFIKGITTGVRTSCTYVTLRSNTTRSVLANCETPADTCIEPPPHLLNVCTQASAWRSFLRLQPYSLLSSIHQRKEHSSTTYVSSSNAPWPIAVSLVCDVRWAFLSSWVACTSGQLPWGGFGRYWHVFCAWKVTEHVINGQPNMNK